MRRYGIGYRFRATVAVVLCLLCVSCGDAPVQGEVARINGRAVTLAQLEAMRDAVGAGAEGSLPQTTEQLRREYGFALAELLVCELVNQQLEKKKIPVTPEEIAAEETLIRGDYPGNSFETMLREEAIDLDLWRFLLKNRLAVQKLRRELLRPSISIKSEEVEAYYHQNNKEFARPAWVYYIVISGTDKASVESARALLLSTADPSRVRRDFPDLQVLATRMSRDRLAPPLEEAIARLKPGQTTAVRAAAQDFRTMLLLDEGPEKRLTPTEAYPLIEAVLLERKLDEAYDQWADKQLARAKIRVARQFLPQAGNNSTPQGAASGNATTSAP